MPFPIEAREELLKVKSWNRKGRKEKQDDAKNAKKRDVAGFGCGSLTASAAEAAFIAPLIGTAEAVPFPIDGRCRFLARARLAAVRGSE